MPSSILFSSAHTRTHTHTLIFFFPPLNNKRSKQWFAVARTCPVGSDMKTSRTIASTKEIGQKRRLKNIELCVWMCVCVCVCVWISNLLTFSLPHQLIAFKDGLERFGTGSWSEICSYMKERTGKVSGWEVLVWKKTLCAVLFFFSITHSLATLSLPLFEFLSDSQCTHTHTHTHTHIQRTTHAQSLPTRCSNEPTANAGLNIARCSQGNIKSTMRSRTWSRQARSPTLLAEKAREATWFLIIW